MGERQGAPIRICFVCLGNICRSPTAEAIMKHLVAERGFDDRIEVESAGTGDWHVGEPRDARSREVAARRGMPLSGLAQQFTAEDFSRFERIVAMDRKNLATLSAMAPDAASRSKLALLRSHDPAGPAGESDVPDPYFGGAAGFDRVFDICLAACRALLAVVVAAASPGEAS